MNLLSVESLCLFDFLKCSSVLIFWLCSDALVKINLYYFYTIELIIKPPLLSWYSKKYLVYIYIYPPDSQENDGGAYTYGKQLPRPAFGDAVIAVRWNLIEI